MANWKCYLYFTPASEGTLFSKWSKTPVENALAEFKPDANAKIPGYLTKNEGHRQELCREMSASRVQEYFRGYATFVKSAYKFNAVVINHATDGGTDIFTKLVFLTPDDLVYFPKNEEGVMIKDYVAVAVLKTDSNILDGVKTTTKGQFVDKVTQSGAYAIRFDR